MSCVDSNSISCILRAMSEELRTTQSCDVDVDSLLTAREVAKRCGISYATVLRKAEQREIPYVRLGNGRIKLPREVVGMLTTYVPAKSES